MEQEDTKHWEKGMFCAGGGTMNPADLCRECELASRNRELERRLSEMAIEVAIMRLLMRLRVGGRRRRKNNEERNIVSRYLLD